MERHCKNAEAVAQFLAARPEVEAVSYPTLAGDPYHEAAKKYLPDGLHPSDAGNAKIAARLQAFLESL